MTARKPNQAGAIAKRAAQNQQVAEKKQPESLQDWVQVMLPQISRALPSVITPERFTRVVLTALSSTPQLALCTRDSFLGGMMLAAQLGLEPNTPLGQAYLIPYRNNKKGVMECQFQIGYKGLIDLAYRSGEVASVQTHCVYANDEFDYELGLEPVLKHKPTTGARGDLIAVYAVFKLKNGGYGFEVMSADDINAHMRKYSKAANKGNSPWQTNFDEMAKKTVLKRVLKLAPLRSEFARGVVADGGTFEAQFDDGGNADIIEAPYEVGEYQEPEEERADAAASDADDSGFDAGAVEFEIDPVTGEVKI